MGNLPVLIGVYRYSYGGSLQCLNRKDIKGPQVVKIYSTSTVYEEYLYIPYWRYRFETDMIPVLPITVRYKFVLFQCQYRYSVQGTQYKYIISTCTVYPIHTSIYYTVELYCSDGTKKQNALPLSRWRLVVMAFSRAIYCLYWIDCRYRTGIYKYCTCLQIT